MPTDQIQLSPGSLPNDQRNREIQAPKAIRTQDGAATPVVSPKTAVGVTPVAFTPKATDTFFIFRAVQAATAAYVWYGDNATLDGSGSGNGYKVGSLGADIAVPCSGMSAVYVRADAGTVDIDFHFENVT